MCIRHLIQGHPVHFDGFLELPQLYVDVSHVDLEAMSICEHLILCNHLIRVEGFVVHLIVSVLVRQVEQHLGRQCEAQQV